MHVGDERESQREGDGARGIPPIDYSTASVKVASKGRCGSRARKRQRSEKQKGAFCESEDEETDASSIRTTTLLYGATFAFIYSLLRHRRRVLLQKEEEGEEEGDERQEKMTEK